MKYRSKWLYSSLCGLFMGAAAMSAQAAQIGMETASAQSISGLLPQTMASYWGKAGVDVQLSMDQTLTKSLLKVARGSLDAAVIPPPAFAFLKKGTGPYAGLGEKAAESAKNVRGLFAFPSSYFQIVTWADSGIKTCKDAVNKRIYIGPPAGSANAQIRQTLAACGINENQYFPIKAPWGAATQGFQDGQFDVYVGAFPSGAQTLAELSLSRKIHLLSIPEATSTPPSGVGLVKGVIPHNAYPGQVNAHDVNAWQNILMVGVRKDMSDDVAYELTKTYFENIKKAAKTNAILQSVVGSNPFAGMNIPLHPGAIRYYKEAGIKIPADLLK